MKSLLLTIVSLIFLSLITCPVFSQQSEPNNSELGIIAVGLTSSIEKTEFEQQPSPMIPRWICAYFAVSNDINQKTSRISITNFSMQTVDAILIFRDDYGQVVKKYDIQLIKKGTINRVFESKDFNGSSSGSVELQASSPAVFPSLSFTTNEVGHLPGSNEPLYYTVRESVQWHRLGE